MIRYHINVHFPSYRIAGGIINREGVVRQRRIPKHNLTAGSSHVNNQIFVQF